MTLEEFSLDGKVALVTGASRGLGAAIAVGLARAGADVAGVARGDQEETRRNVEKSGRKYAVIGADLAQREQVEEIVTETVKRLGRVDILVNNAGTTHRDEAIDYPMEKWDEVMEVNLRAMFRLSQLAARQMLKQHTGGKIINIASLASFQGGLYIPAYVASKSGVAGLTRALSNEWGRLGINVNAIAPGYFKTDMTEPLIDDPVRGPEILGRIPCGRWGETGDLVGPAVFLAGRASDYCHGTVLVVDGGWMAR